MHKLDHLLWQERDLREGEARFAELTGVTAVYGGPHAEGGTHNSLLSLGGRFGTTDARRECTEVRVRATDVQI